MKPYQKITLVLLLFPFFVFAHGQEALIPLGISIFSVIGIILFLWLISIPLKKKGLLFLIFFITSIVVGYYTSTIPFNDNQTLISFLLIVPLLISLISYQIIKNKSNF